jgi:hypothetical protein
VKDNQLRCCFPNYSKFMYVSSFSRKQKKHNCQLASVFQLLCLQMPLSLTNIEYANMHLVHGEVGQNSRAAVRRYQELYPNKRLPSRGVFADVHRRLCEFGQVQQNTWSVE